MPMPRRDSGQYGTLPANVQACIDRIRDQFEEAWKQGQRPRLEDHLREVAAEGARAAEAGATAAERRAKWLTVGLAAAVLLLLAVGGGGGWWLRHERLARQAEDLARHPDADQRAGCALEQAREALAEGWEKHDAALLALARAEADKAVEVARGGAGNKLRGEAEALRNEVQAKTAQAEKNQRLLTALLDVSEPREPDVHDKDGSGRVMAVAQPTSDEQFAAAFRRWGVDMDEGTAQHVIAQLGPQPGPVVQEVVAGLDQWSQVRRRAQRPEAEWRRLSMVAEQLDGDPGHREVRRLWRSKQAQAQVAGRLREFAAALDPANEPVLGVVTLARALDAAGDTPGAERLYRAALAARPGEVVLLYALGHLLERQQPPRLGEAIECFRTARGLRPQLGIALGVALLEAGRAPEGEAVFRDLVRRQSDSPAVLCCLGDALRGQKKLDEAVAAYRKAIDLKPDFAEAYNNLGIALSDQNKRDEAVAAFRRADQLLPGNPIIQRNLRRAER
jgi:tetratricopeptide (TPR) repeat protein